MLQNQHTLPRTFIDFGRLPRRPIAEVFSHAGPRQQKVLVGPEQVKEGCFRALNR